MFDDAPRKNHSVSHLRGPAADDEVFCEIIAQFGEAPQGLDHLPLGCQCWPQCKIHSSQHPGDQNSSKKLRVYADCFQLRPQFLSRHATIRAGHNPNLWVTKLGHNRSQQFPRHVHVAICHHQNVMFGPRNQVSQAVSLSVGNDRLSRFDQLHTGTARKMTLHFSNQDGCWIVAAMNSKKDLVVWIVQHEEAAQIVFQAIIPAA